MRDKQRLYLMRNSIGLSKIGISANPERRRRQIENASGFSVRLIGCWKTLEADAFTVEQSLHKLFSRKRLNGEWFENIGKLDIRFSGYELVECNIDGTERSKM